jgi:signal peptidase
MKVIKMVEIKKQFAFDKRHKVLTILGIILCVIMVPILIFNISLIIQGFADPNEVPGVFGLKPMMVLTDSMSPTIKSGDLIIIKEIEPSTLEVGDIITFYDPAGNGQSTVTHTIKSISVIDGKLMFETKGDNNNIPDRLLVEDNAVIGIYLFRIPLVANFTMFIQTVPGLISCIFVPLGALIIFDLFRRRIYDRKQEAYKHALLDEIEALRNKNN